MRSRPYDRLSTAEDTPSPPTDHHDDARSEPVLGSTTRPSDSCFRAANPPGFSNHETRAGWVESITFSWMNPLLKTVRFHARTSPSTPTHPYSTPHQGKSRPLEFEDLQELETNDQARHNGSVVGEAWASELRSGGAPSILRALMLRG